MNWEAFFFNNDKYNQRARFDNSSPHRRNHNRLITGHKYRTFIHVLNNTVMRMTYLTIENDTMRGIEWNRVKRKAEKAGVNPYEAYLQYQDISGYIFEVQSQNKFRDVADNEVGRLNREDAEEVALTYGYPISYEVLQDVIEGFTCDDTMVHSMIATNNADSALKRINSGRKGGQSTQRKIKASKTALAETEGYADTNGNINTKIDRI